MEKERNYHLKLLLFCGFRAHFFAILQNIPRKHRSMKNVIPGHYEQQSLTTYKKIISSNKRSLSNDCSRGKISRNL